MDFKARHVLFLASLRGGPQSVEPREKVVGIMLKTVSSRKSGDDIQDLDGEDAKPDSAYQSARKQFARKDLDFDSVVNVVWGKDFEPHGFYQHYTTLSSLVDKLSGRWWFARSDNGELNDKQESIKFGNKKISARTYQTSFVHGAAESVALWSLYAPSDPFAVRITIPGKALKDWVDGLKGDCLHFGDSPKSREIKCAELKDIIYAAVAFSDRGTREDNRMKSRDIPRCNSLYWAEVNCGANIPDLEQQIKKDCCTGWMKDYEWRHERESRICLRVERAGGPKALWCKVTSDLIEKMKFTFSPWLPIKYEDQVRDIILSALKPTESERGPNAKKYADRFRRSVVQGAIYLRHSKLVCAFENGEDASKSCPLLKSNKVAVHGKECSK
jgi:hypothetical protein